jgi:hypothetical protein
MNDAGLKLSDKAMAFAVINLMEVQEKFLILKK